MSIEEALAANTLAIEAMTAGLAAVLAGAAPSTTQDSAPTDTAAATKAKAAAATKAKAAAATMSKAVAAAMAKEKAKEGTGDEDGDSFVTLRKQLSAWLGEFAKEEDKENPDGIHPEMTARHEAIRATLVKLNVKLLNEIKGDEGKITKLSNWLNDKAIPVDKGFGVGRLVADPEEETVEDDDGLNDI
jgi:hypothetical protein